MDAPPVQYVTTSDGYSIAYAVSGEGRPVIWMPHMFTHIEIYWAQNTFIRPWLEALASRFQLIQYDGRGQGLSTRGLPESFSLADLELDLEAVVGHLGLESVVLIALAWSGHVAVRFTAKNRQRVEALVLQSCPIKGLPASINTGLAREDWDAFIRSVAAMGQPQDVPASLSRLKQTVTQRDYLAIAGAAVASDIGGLLPLLHTPTLVIHPRDYFGMAVDEAMRLASRIAGARLTVTDGATAPGDPIQSLKAIEDFLASRPPRGEQPSAPRRAGAGALPDGLSAREAEVLRLIAAGKTNRQIAGELVITLNTVQHHVSSILAKTGAANRTEAAAHAHRHGLV